jgi:predicted nucleotidyltransferase
LITLPSTSDIIARARAVIERYDVERAILFGSFAAGRQSARSDVDLLLVVRTSDRFFDRYTGILADLQSVFPDRDVEVLIYTPGELEAMSQRVFVARVLREGKVIYERGRAA